LGLSDVSVEKLELMGVCDHFHSNIVGDQNISTLYVNLPHYIVVDSKPFMTIDNQHGDFQWFDLSMVSGNQNCHPSVRNYAGRLSSARC
jgi:hypothetical protein